MKPLHLLRIGLNVLAALLVAVAALVGWQRVQGDDTGINPTAFAEQAAQADSPASPVPENEAGLPDLPPFATPSSLEGGIPRLADLDTIIPTRPRDEVVTYTVRLGDNLFSIGEGFGLKPETILWGNFETLQDNPEILQVDQVLNILPVDGVYYQWKEGDNLEGVASFFKVEPEDILIIQDTLVISLPALPAPLSSSPGTG
jgi:hypothetical protein